MTNINQFEDGMIRLDSDRGKSLNFTSDRFSHGSYLWKLNGAIIISFIASRQKGNFRQLANAILDAGFKVQIPIPRGRMKDIVRKAGYTQTSVRCNDLGEPDPNGEQLELWVMEPKEAVD